MGLQEITPMLRTKNLKNSVAFYTALLGFQCEAFNEEWGWASVKQNNLSIRFASPNAHEPFDKPTFTGSLYLRCDNVDVLWEQLKDKVKICYPIENFHYGMREFAIYDNDGYLVQLGQEISEN